MVIPVAEKGPPDGGGQETSFSGFVAGGQETGFTPYSQPVSPKASYPVAVPTDMPTMASSHPRSESSFFQQLQRLPSLITKRRDDQPPRQGTAAAAAAAAAAMYDSGNNGIGSEYIPDSIAGEGGLYSPTASSEAVEVPKHNNTHTRQRAHTTGAAFQHKSDHHHHHQQQQQQHHQHHQYKSSGDVYSDQYLPEEFEFTPTIASATTMVNSPTLGLSETEWKKIPFSTRRKLRVAFESGSPLTISAKDLPANITRSLRSAPVSLSGSVSGSITDSSNTTSPCMPSSPKYHPFSRRMKERAATMYPSLTNIDESLATARPLSRSISLSNNSSYSGESPAFQFLSRFGSLTSDTATTSANGFLTFDPDMGDQVGKFFLGKMIGYGGFSMIKEAHTMDDNGNKIVLAVKIVQKSNPKSTAERMERIQSEFDHEVAVWKGLEHPHILRLISVEDNTKAIYCFTDRITGGTLFDLVKATRGHNIDCDAITKYVFQLGSALLYLHETKFIVHRDVKLENCLLEDIGNGQRKVLLCDFGLSDYYEPDHTSVSKTAAMSDTSVTSKSSRSTERSGNHIIGPSDTSSQFDTHHHHNHFKPDATASTAAASKQSSLESSPAATPSSTQNFGSMPYASPQLLVSDVPIYHPSVDMWAYGVVVYALFMGHLPWHHSFLPRLRNMILDAQWDDKAMEDKVGKDLTDIVRGCLQKDETQRIDIRQVMYDDMFKTLRENYPEVLR
jgi:serine/threonine protein kinase